MSSVGTLVQVCLLIATPTLQEKPVFKDHQAYEKPGPPDTCLSGPFHKKVPSPEDDSFDECLSWQNEACCNAEVPRIIDNHKAVGLYNYSWDLCGTLSQKCEEFIKDEECFYQCEAMLGYFETSPGSGYISGVPVCASYCDRWFEACKDDLTCVVDWLADFDFAENGNNSCPKNSTCITFEEQYGNAEGLCNKMWGVAFFYSRDENNCTVMSFNPSNGNPNYGLTFPRQRLDQSISITTAADAAPNLASALLLTITTAIVYLMY